MKFKSEYENDSNNNNNSNHNNNSNINNSNKNNSNNNIFLFDKISNKFNKYKNSEKSLRNYCLNILEHNDKNIYKFFEEDLEDIGSLKSYKKKKVKKLKNLKDKKKERKELLFGKKLDKKNNGQILNDSYNNVTDKIITSTLNALNEYEKDKGKNKDSKLAYINQQNLNSYEKIVQNNNLEKSKTNNCLVF